MTRQPYIIDGEIVRDPRRTRSPLHYFSRARFLAVFGVCLVLAISNPGNEHVFGNLSVLGAQKSPLSNGSTNKRFLQPSVTNYGIFSIEERFDAVLVSGLLQSWTCPYYDRELGPFCKVIAENFSHQKSFLWDRKDRAYTAHRIICFTLIASALVSFCFPGAPPQTSLFYNPILDGFFSIFYRPNIMDLIYTNSYIYPALVEINRMVPRLDKGSVLFSFGDVDLDFALAVVILIFGIGGGCNMAASRLTKRRVYGLHSTIGASLAYYQQATLYRPVVAILFRVYDQPITASGAYWTMLGIMVVTSNRDWFPGFVAWMLAGGIGSCYARYHLESQMWWGNLFHFIGLF